MRIAVDVSQTCVQRAGCAWVADSFARQLVSTIGTENVVLYHQFGEWINTETRNGTKIDDVESPFLGLSYNEAKRKWRNIEEKKCVLPGAPDIVHSFSFMSPAIPSAKLVYTIHDLCFWTHPQYSTEENRVLCQKQLTKSLKYASAFTFVSQQSKEDFETVLPDFLKNKNLPHQIIEPYARPLAVDTEYSDIEYSGWLYIGTIEPRKGITRLLDEYVKYYYSSKIKQPLSLIGGEGWNSREIHKQITILKKKFPIHYLGYQDESTLTNELKKCFGLVSLSNYEGFGLPILEAASIGKPIISTNTPSFLKYKNMIAFYQKKMDPHERMLALEEDTSLHDTVSSSLKKISNENKTNWAPKALQLYTSIL